MNGNHVSVNNAEKIGINIRPGPLPINAKTNDKNRQLTPLTAS